MGQLPSSLFEAGLGMPARRVGPFDRPDIAMANLLRADPHAAAQALLSPNSLSPAQRQGLADQMVPEGTGGVVKALAGVVTNPLFLLGTLLAVKYPIPTAAKVFEVEKRYSAYHRQVAPILRQLNPAWDSYRGTATPSLLNSLALNIVRYVHAHMPYMVEGVEKWERAHARRQFRNSTQNILLHAKLGGLDREVTRKIKTIKRVGGRIDDILIEERTFPAIFKPIKLDKQTEELYDYMRRNYRAQWGALTYDPKKLVRSIKGMRGLDIGDPDRAFLEGLMDKETLDSLLRAKHLSDEKLEKILLKYFEPEEFYHPRYALGGADRFEFRAAQAKLEGADPSSVVRRGDILDVEGRLIQEGVGPRARKRVRGATSTEIQNPSLSLRNMRLWDNYDPAALEKVRPLLRDPSLPEKIRDRALAMEREGKLDARTMPLTMDALGAWEEYTNRAARTYNLYVQEIPDFLSDLSVKMASKKPLSKGMSYSEAFRAELESLPSDALRRDLVDVWLPAAKGQLTVPQFTQRMSWVNLKRRFAETLDAGGTASQPGSLVGQTLQKALGKERYENFRLGMERVPRGQIGTALSGYFYASTLGASPGAALQNLFQTYLTTVQFVPMKYIVQGQLKAVRDMKKYVQLRLGGTPSAEAADEAFSTLVSIGQELDPRFTRGLAAALDAGFHQAQMGVRGLPKTYDKVNGVLMGMFANSERFVRLTAAHSAEAFAKASGYKVDSPELLEFVGRVVQSTQFSAGVANTPRYLANWPGPLRQFLTFPSRLASSLTSTSPYVGGEGRRFLSGGLGRSLLYSTAIYEGAQAMFDTDVDRMLLFGGLPVPEDEGPLAPLPVVPPAVGIVASGLHDLAAGEIDQLKFTAPTLFPGGVSGAKVLPIAAPDIAEQLGLAKVDWDAPTGDGRYPYYSQSGALAGYFPASQLALKALGIDQTGTQREGAILHYLTTQRDQIREMRRQYSEFIFQNEFDKAEKIQRDWSNLYPEMGPMTVTEEDYKNYVQREMVTRLERALQTLPPELRPLMAGSIVSGLSPRFDQLFGLDPALLYQGAGIRDASRMGLTPQVPQGVRFGQSRYGSPSSQSEEGASRRQLVGGGFTPFQPF